MRKNPPGLGDDGHIQELQSAIAARLDAMRGLTNPQITDAATDIVAMVAARLRDASHAVRSASTSAARDESARAAGLKGRELHIGDVRARLPKGPDGKPPSDWYIRHVMAEVGQFRIGKWHYVYEADLEHWLATRLDDD